MERCFVDFINLSDKAMLFISSKMYKEILDNVQKNISEEVCGLIGGVKSTAFKVYPITNELHDSTRFRMDASEQVKALIDIENNGWDLIAIYHSHLKGPGIPSETDSREFRYPGVIYLIVNLSSQAQIMRGFHMCDNVWNEISIIVTAKE
jgi:proteasome lid subunit RPN8/RPN11